MALVEALGREEERAQLTPIQPSPFRWVDLRPFDVLGGIGTQPAVNVVAGPATFKWLLTSDLGQGHSNCLLPENADFRVIPGSTDRTRSRKTG
jgi:hypothetical protein